VSQPVSAAQPLPVRAELPPPVKTVLPPPVSKTLPAPTANAHIALLLPLNSSAFGRAAEAVKQGFMAASTIQAGTLPVKIYPSGDKVDDIVSAYSLATQAGALIVAGPLTKNGVTALAASNQVTVPTLALNLPERDMDLPPQLYLLSLSADIEARQIAKAAFAEGRKSATIIVSGGALEKRVQQAFAAEWPILGGTVIDQFNFTGANTSAIQDALQKHAADMLFLAMDGQDARVLRPYLSPDIPTYATSQIYAGKNNPQKYYDLNGIQFVDMPWLLQPDHAAVMVYPRPQGGGADMERLYALGIDAWRLALMLQNIPPGKTLTLDGVTGQLNLDPASHQFTRTGVRAEFRDGEAVLPAP